MKKPEEYIDKTIDWEDLYEFQTINKIIALIKQVQIDTIEETCKVCAENAITDGIEVNQDEYNYVAYRDWVNVDKQSILNCAEILKKELE